MLLLHRRELPPRDLEYLERATDAHEIVGVEAGRRFDVDLRESGVQRRSASFAGQVCVALANLRVAGGRVRQPVEQRPHPKERATAHHREFASRAHIFERCGGRGGVAGGVEGLERVDAVHQMMGHALPVGHRRLARTNVEVAVDLNAIGSDDLAAPGLGQPKRELALSRGGRTDHDRDVYIAEIELIDVQPCAPVHPIRYG
jgi:hypothetical protein